MPDISEISIKLDADAWLDDPSEVIGVLAKVESQKVEILAEDASAIGTQIAQLLLSAIKSASEGEGELKIIAPSEAFLNCISKLGLETAFSEAML